MQQGFLANQDKRKKLHHITLYQKAEDKNLK